MNKTLKFVLVAVAAMMAAVASAGTRIIAHRGYWTLAGSAQNSIASLEATHHIGAYGSEFDVWITQDNQLVVNHNPEIGGVNIENARYKDIKDKKLKNGECISTLRQYLEAGKQHCQGTQLILEIKPHKVQADEDRCVDAVVKMVADEGMEQQVEYISFSMKACERLVAAGARHVSYLGSDVEPKEIKEKGMSGIDYAGPAFAVHPEWIKQAHDLGLTVNVWTIDDLDDVDGFIKAGVDFITTNKPVEAMKLAR